MTQISEMITKMIIALIFRSWYVYYI